MLIGGVAVAARGVRRLTDDVDAVLWAEGVDLQELLSHLSKAGIVPRISDATAFALETQVLLLRHRPTKIDIDLSLAWLPFENAALDRADAVQFGRSKVRVAQPADLIVYKAIAARERDRSDIERLLQLHGPAIDFAEVRRTVSELSGALERPELLTDLERIARDVSAAKRRSKPAPRRKK
jgi:hypothetical protein